MHVTGQPAMKNLFLSQHNDHNGLESTGKKSNNLK
jgi:hypothetical protein